MKKILILALVLTAACASNGVRSSPRHRAAVASQDIAAALFGLQDAEAQLFTAGKVTTLQHQRFAAQLVPVLTLGKDVNSAVLAWQAGQPAPQVLQRMLPALEALTNDAIAALPLASKDRLLASLASVYQTVAIVLALMTGGA